MSNKRVLIAEISGKRAGDSTARPTEMFEFDFDKVIISNNSEGYVTDWPIIDVPSDYQEWYKAHIKTNDKAFYAPMNRSYAIKYAREKGYDYLIQLDDNILSFGIRYMQKSGGLYATVKETPYTRIIEHKHFEYGTQPKTVITKEHSQTWQRGDEPYYPVNNDRNNHLYTEYKELAKTTPNVIFGGRLGHYRYYDMHQVIAAALQCVGVELLGGD